METFLIKALQLIVSLSILVLVHEFGHFIFARIFKVRVEKFYIFFDPWFALFKYKPKNSDTEYGVGWLPLGGYCKISGMIDESFDTEQMAQPPKPYEFRSKPAWQRLLIMTAGVIFNFILAIVIYSMVLFHWGDTYLPLKNVTMGMGYSELLHDVGFRDGDILVAADGEELERFDDINLRKIIEGSEATVLRNGQKVQIPIPDDMMRRLLREKTWFAEYRFPMVVGELADDSPAKAAGMLVNDSIVSVNGVATLANTEVTKALQENKGKEVEIGLYRNGQEMTLTASLDSTGLLGFYAKSPFAIYKTEKKTYNFFTSFPAGIVHGVNTLKGYASDMKYAFTKEGASSLGGFGTIGQLFPAKWNWLAFWERTAFLSIILAFMNILPIPALDGGYVMFLLYEVITRRKPSDKFLEYANMVGLFILFGLLIYANGNDLVRYLFNK